MACQTINCTIEEEKIFCNIKEEPVNVAIQSEENKFYFNIINDTTPIKCNLLEEVPINIILEKGGVVNDILQFLDTLASYLLQEDLTSQVLEGQTDFITNSNFYPSTLKVYINGLKERIVIILSNNSFRISPGVEIGDSIEVEFVKKIE